MVGPDALVAAALELLRTSPPAQVTRAAVARQARVDPSLIRYYFKDRMSLLVAVLHRIVTGNPIGLPEAGAAAEQLAAYVRGFFGFNAAYPYVHRLIVEELATSDSAAARLAFHDLHHRALHVLGTIAAQAAKDKSLRHFDPVHLHIAIVGLCEFFLSAGVLLEDALGKDYDRNSVTKRYAEFIVDFVVDGMRKR